MFFTKEKLRNFTKIIIIESIIIGLLWISFIIFFVLSLINIKKMDVNFIKIMSISLAVISLWVTIFFVTTSLSEAITKLSVFKTINKFNLETYKGEIIKFDSVRTVNKRIQAREIEIQVNEKEKRIFYLDLSYDINLLKINEVVTLKAKSNYVMEIIHEND